MKVEPKLRFAPEHSLIGPEVGAKLFAEWSVAAVVVAAAALAADWLHELHVIAARLPPEAAPAGGATAAEQARELLANARKAKSKK